MRRFLVVGCGGSGGATLAYLMDQLRSDLEAHGVHGLPRGWQFVHIDVPNESDEGPEGLGNVRQQGGRYFGSGPRDATYRTLDKAVSQRFAERGALGAIATWAPREPDSVNRPISVGAGQYRAIGRVITLSRAAEIQRVLREAWDELSKVDTTSEMEALDVPGLGEYKASKPTVLVVSSMAGGAGASMALDVCRLLTLVPGVDPDLIGMFMVAPNVFDSVAAAARMGVRPNALAMLGEIVACQVGSAKAHDEAALAALGLTAGSGAPKPFARVFPVGRFVGVDHAQFGNGRPEAIYRGLGRGLAGLIMSGTATEQFVSYDLGNENAPEIDRNALGWGARHDDLVPWGSYGFASLSMGRDRYAEYAAQRLARGCVDRLLDGHLQVGSTVSANDQVSALLDSQWRGRCQRAGLPPLGSSEGADREFGRWLTEHAFPRPVIDELARMIVDREIRAYLWDPTGHPARQWEQAVRERMVTRRGALTEAVEQDATAQAYAWHQRLRGDVEAVVTEAVAELGLGFAVGFIDRLTAHLQLALGQAADDLAQHAVPDVSVIPPDMDTTIASLPRGAMQNGRAIVDDLLAQYRRQIGNQIWALISGTVRRLLDGLAVDVLEPLKTTLAESQRILVHARETPVSDVGLARLATGQYNAWPADSDQRVPVRFDQADNEVMLTTSKDFPEQFVNDVRRALPGGMTHYEVARHTVIGQIVSGLWVAVDAGHAPGSPLQTRTEWRSRVFPMEPSSGRMLTPAPARYELLVSTEDLVARARAFVGRRGESFDVFCRLSIREFLEGTGGESPLELADRARAVVTRFRETLELARPLISVNSVALQAVHPGAHEVDYRYKFSEVPVAALQVRDVLRRVLEDDPMIDSSSRETFEAAVGDGNGVTRIDVFGSYPNYSPLAFDAVLAPAAEQWAQVGENGRASFWQWRRSRPLDASLPMSRDERLAMVGGWLIGQVIGRIRIPDRGVSAPVQILEVDPDANWEWLDFPHPMLTPPSRFLTEFEWLPAVLESVLIAIARSHEAPVMSSLRPYRVLRELFDASPQDPVRSAVYERSGQELINDWVLGWTGTPGGGRSRVDGAEAALTPDDRAEAAITWLGRIRGLSENYLPGGKHGALTRRDKASGMPLFRDLAPDVHTAVQDIVGMLQNAPRDLGDVDHDEEIRF